MTESATDDKELRGRHGAIDKALARAPLQITERPFQHTAHEDTDCYDCENLISRGEPFMVSALEVTKGVKGKQHRYSIHLACYDVVGRVVMILGKSATHTMEGRPKLKDLWAANKVAIRGADPELADMLKGAFG